MLTVQLVSGCIWFLSKHWASNYPLGVFKCHKVVLRTKVGPTIGMVFLIKWLSVYEMCKRNYNELIMRSNCSFFSIGYHGVLPHEYRIS